MPWFDLQLTAPIERWPGFSGHFVHSERMTIAHWTIRAGSALPPHAHPHEQIVNVIDGEFELTFGGETRRVGPGEVAVIPGNVEHSGRAISDCRIIDAFSPVREDYKDRQPTVAVK